MTHETTQGPSGSQFELRQLLRDATAELSVGQKAKVETVETRQKADELALAAIKMETLSQEVDQQTRDLFLRAVDAFNNVNRNSGVASPEMITYALDILRGLGADSKMIGRYQDALSDTFPKLLQAGTQFVLFEDDGLRVERSPGNGQVSLSIDDTLTDSERLGVLIKGQFSPILNVGVDDRIFSMHTTRIATALAAANGVVNAPDISAEPADLGAVIKSSRIGKSLLESPLKLGTSAEVKAETAKAPLRKYAVLMAEKISSRGYFRNSPEANALLSAVDELRRSGVEEEGNQSAEAIEDVFYELSESFYKLAGPSSEDRIEMIIELVLKKNGIDLNSATRVERLEYRAHAELETAAMLRAHPLLGADDGAEVRARTRRVLQ